LTYALVRTRHFDRRLDRFRRAHPELRQRIARVLRDLETDPFQPGLRMHPLRGELDGLHAVSLTYAYRLILTLRVSEREIVLLDIGSHDEVYG
jgi:mRNA-degrading endonuclease YafQ of YafQ-DinJ toxin-antitoxin module